MASLAGAGVLMNAPGRWRTGVGVAMWDIKRMSTAWASGPSLEGAPSQDRAGGSRRRAKVDGRWSVVGGRRQQLRLSRFSVLRRGNRMAPSYRNINGAWPAESRRVENLERSRSRSRSEERAAAGR